MLDIPMFTTDNGVASLILNQIPYTHCAYIRIQDASEPGDFIKECGDFCRAAGAEAIFATGHSSLESSPVHCITMQMQCAVSNLDQVDACLFPVCEETSEQWRSIYNTRMSGVPNAAYLTKRDVQKIIRQGSGYFVHWQGKLLGIGVASGGTIDAVISTEKGEGYRVLCALSGALTEDTALVEVASVNEPAIRLYQKAGFVKIREIDTWYKIS